MSTPSTQLPATIQARTEVEFIPFGSEDRIKLNLAVIRNYIATPTKQGDLPDDRSCMRFLMLCRSRRLDPFTGDAYLIGFRKGGSEEAEWNLITSQSAFMKRAEIHPEFDGLASGIIVKDSEDRIIEREGDFEYEGDTLLGGWAVVHFKNRKHPMIKKVTLKTYRKPFGVWVTDPAGMICKVAEVHALRDAFPTMLGGMMLREEYIDVESTVTPVREIRRPEFAQGLPAPEIGTTTTTGNARITTPKAPNRSQARSEASDHQTTKPAPQNTQEAANPAQDTPSTRETTPEPDAETTGNVTAEPPVTDEAAEAAAGLAPQTRTEAAVQEGGKGEFKAKAGEGIPLTSVRRWLHEVGKTEAQLMAVLRTNKAAKEGQKLADLAEAKIDNVYRARASLLTQMAK